MRNTAWRYISEDNVSASYGLAADEFLIYKTALNDRRQAALRLYNYQDHCVLSGRFQDLATEIDVDKCKELGYPFSRRLTGGGAIIMGGDQLGICLATHSDFVSYEHVRELYHLFSKPVINALSDLGINASFRSKNDLEVDGKKIAGLGVHISPEGGIQFHTSLLIDLDVDVMLKVLKIPVQKYADKVLVRSVEQRTTTINRETGGNYQLNEIREMIAGAFSSFFGAELEPAPFSVEEKLSINQLEEDKYNDAGWLFQHSPQDDMTGVGIKKTSGGLLRTYIGLKGNTIKSVMITGDYFDQNNLMQKIETDLKWSALDRDKISKSIAMNFKKDGKAALALGIEVEELTDAIWLAAQRASAAHRYTYRGSCYYPKEEKEKITEKV